MRDTLVVWWNERQAGKILTDNRGAMHVEAMHFKYAPEGLADETVPAVSFA